MNTYVSGQVYLILPSGVTSSGLCHSSDFPGCIEAAQAHQSPGAAVNPSPGLSLGALEISTGNVTFLMWQSSFCQPAHLSIQAGYESYLGITHMHLVKTATNADAFDLWEGKKGELQGVNISGKY